jgi:hypothetical protein
MVLAVVTAVQAFMLHSRGWRIAMGSLPEYLATIGTFATAVGAIVAVGTTHGDRKVEPRTC